MMMSMNSLTKFQKISILKAKQQLLFIILFIGSFQLPSLFAQFDIPPKPATQTSVYDYANILSESEKSALEQKLINYADTTSTQIVIATVESINGENIGLLTPRWAQEWGVGQSKEDNGVFILLAEKERSIWISPGYGLEHLLTAGINGEIVRNIIIPEFKKGDYYAGLNKGTNALMDLFSGSYQGTPQPSNRPSGSSGVGFLFIFIVFVIIIIILSNNRNNRGGRNGGRSGIDLLDIIILSNLGRGGTGGFGGSGGGFGGGGFGGGFGGGGFGGGGFSGGGAGGSW